MSCSAGWIARVSGPHQGKQYKSTRVCRPSSLCLPTDQSPSEGQRKAAPGPEAIKALMAFDSNFFMSPQPEGPASGEIGCLLLPIKAHKLCPQTPLNGISVLSQCVCACVSERTEETGLRSDWGRGHANGEMVLVTGPKGLDAFLQLLHQFRQGSKPSREHI